MSIYDFTKVGTSLDQAIFRDILLEVARESFGKDLAETGGFSPTIECEGSHQAVEGRERLGYERDEVRKKISSEDIADIDVFNRFFINVPRSLSAKILGAKIRAQALLCERFFFSNIASIPERLQTFVSLCDRQLTLVREAHEFTITHRTQEGGQEGAESLLLSESLHSDLLVMACKFQRILFMCFQDRGLNVKKNLDDLLKQLQVFQSRAAELDSKQKIMSSFLETTIKFTLFFLEDREQVFSRKALIIGMIAQMKFLKTIKNPCPNPYSRALLAFTEEFPLETASFLAGFSSQGLVLSMGKIEEFLVSQIKRLRDTFEKVEKILKIYRDEYSERSREYSDVYGILKADRSVYVKLCKTDAGSWLKYFISVGEFNEGFLTEKREVSCVKTKKTDERSDWLTPCCVQARPRFPRLALKPNTVRVEKHVSKTASVDVPLIFAGRSSTTIDTKPDERTSLIGCGPELNRAYLYHVSRWFDQETSDPFNDDPSYAGKAFTEAQKNRIRIQHAFGRAVHPIIIKRGKCFKNTQTGDFRYTMLGQILYHGEEPEKGIFTISTTPKGAIYHAFFTKKKVSELIGEYREHGFFESKDEEHFVGNREEFCLEDDGSRVSRVDNEAVIVWDPRNKAYLWVYDNVKDSLL